MSVPPLPAARADGHGVPLHPRIVLRATGSPLPLGLLALAGSGLGVFAGAWIASDAAMRSAEQLEGLEREAGVRQQL